MFSNGTEMYKGVRSMLSKAAGMTHMCTDVFDSAETVPRGLYAITIA